MNQPMDSSYEAWRPVLEKVLDQLVRDIKVYNQKEKDETGENAYEHLIYRVRVPPAWKKNASGKGCR